MVFIVSWVVRWPWAWQWYVRLDHCGSMTITGGVAAIPRSPLQYQCCSAACFWDMLKNNNNKNTLFSELMICNAMQCSRVWCLQAAAAAALTAHASLWTWLLVCSSLDQHREPPNILPPWQESLLKSSKTPKSSWFSAWNLHWGHIPSIWHQFWLWSFSKTLAGVNWVQQSGAISKKNWMGGPLEHSLLQHIIEAY